MEQTTVTVEQQVQRKEVRVVMGIIDLLHTMMRQPGERSKEWWLKFRSVQDAFWAMKTERVGIDEKVNLLKWVEKGGWEGEEADALVEDIVEGFERATVKVEDIVVCEEDVIGWATTGEKVILEIVHDRVFVTAVD